MASYAAALLREPEVETNFKVSGAVELQESLTGDQVPNTRLEYLIAERVSNAFVKIQLLTTCWLCLKLK